MRNIFSKLATITAIILTIGMITSCQKNSNLKTKESKGGLTENTLKSMPDVQVENGIVVFKNVGKYLKTIKLLDSYNKSQLINWAKSMGFAPYNKKAKDAVDSLWDVKSESGLNNYMKRFQDFMTARTRDGELYHELIVEPNIFTSIANKNGLYIIGKKAYRILGNYMLEINVNQKGKLLEVHYPDIKNNNVPIGIKMRQYMGTLTFKNNGNYYKNVPIGGDSIPIGGNGGTITDSTKSSPSQSDEIPAVSASNQTSNRKVVLVAHAWSQGNKDQNYVAYKGYVEAIAYKREWYFAWLGWGEYNTEIDIEGTNSTGDDFILETPLGIKSYNFPHLISPTDGWTFKPSAPEYGYQLNWQSYPGPPTYLISVHLKAWTRGTGEDCCADIEYNLY